MTTNNKQKPTEDQLEKIAEHFWHEYIRSDHNGHEDRAVHYLLDRIEDNRRKYGEHNIPQEILYFEDFNFEGLKIENAVLWYDSFQAWLGWEIEGDNTYYYYYWEAFEAKDGAFAYFVVQ